MWASGARLEGTCSSIVKSADWKEASDGSGGWLATGCSGGTVGVSWISSPASIQRETADSCCATPSVGEGSLYKSHFILRGHMGEVNIVRWMPVDLRLASYDSWGHIILWNNRANVLAYEFQINTAIVVTDIQWSPCGLYLTACARSGHILLFSGVTGMSLLSMCVESTTCRAKRASFTCCSWNKPGTRVAFGTSNGEVVLLDPERRRITTRVVSQGVGVQFVDWYGPVIQCQRQDDSHYLSQGLSVCLRNGDFVFYPRPHSRECTHSQSNVVNGIAAWNSDKSALVVIGNHKRFIPVACLLNSEGQETFMVSEDLPKSKFPLRNVLWTLQDSVVMFSCGPHLYSLKVDHSLPSLETLCQHTIATKVVGEGDGASVALPLPKHMINQLSQFNQSLLSNLFDTGRSDILVSLFAPIPHNNQVHCVLESTNSSSGASYILKVEYLNTYIPLLQARRKPSKLASIHIGFSVEPAFEYSHLGHEEEEHWASQVSHCPQREGIPPQPTRPRVSLLRRMWSVFNPIHSPGVMDSTQTSGGAAASAVFSGSRAELTLAEVEGNSLLNQFRFHTNSSLSKSPSLGSVNICTNYLKCKPRNISVAMPTACGDHDKEVAFHSREPEWNEDYQIYELDFGGRVSKDSIKNFQIEHDGQVVLQFGKVDSTRFCLDFQAPFSVVQAMCIALSCTL